ncbi:hypothetical protein [Parabacteroides sp. PF5-9]|uniref:hypothetical protein n=1 Tax=Parabacteroides sp. PF5-9 TaxID=1742404 RepID=UPI002473C369|nr:hypothetical protein [Parabacteroides sp. PF5-9]MDH6358956.1 uncharacterized protein (DUF1919 family) [Parabacteroides sp. PF5-9]
MSTRKETIKVYDRYGFVYEVVLEHKPHFGFTSALYNDTVIAQVENGKIHEPLSDDDLEWERYEDLYAEWTDVVKANISIECEVYFNNHN